MAPAADLFSVEQEILSRLQALAGRMPADKPLHVGSAINVVGTRDVSKFTPGVFVSPAAPDSVDDSGHGITERQVWNVTCAVRSISGRPEMPEDHQALGQLAAAALQAVLRIDDLHYHGREDVQYTVGHVELTLMFACDRALDMASGASGDPDLADFIKYSGQWDLAPMPDAQPDARDELLLPGASAEDVHAAAHAAVRNWPDNDNEDHE